MFRRLVDSLYYNETFFWSSPFPVSNALKGSLLQHTFPLQRNRFECSPWWVAVHRLPLAFPLLSLFKKYLQAIVASNPRRSLTLIFYACLLLDYKAICLCRTAWNCLDLVDVFVYCATLFGSKKRCKFVSSSSPKRINREWRLARLGSYIIILQIWWRYGRLISSRIERMAMASLVSHLGRVIQCLRMGPMEGGSPGAGSGAKSDRASRIATRMGVVGTRYLVGEIVFTIFGWPRSGVFATND